MHTVPLRLKIHWFRRRMKLAADLFLLGCGTVVFILLFLSF